MTWLTCEYGYSEISDELDKFPDVLKQKSTVVGHKGVTLLHCAAGSEEAEYVKLFVEKGAVVDGQDERGVTPLAIAIVNKRFAAVKMLLRLGANVNLRLKRNNTALLCACQYGDSSMAKILLAHGADVNVRNDSGRTALIKAFIEHRKPDLVRLLVRAGANVNDTDIGGKTALMHGCRGGALSLRAIKALFNNPIVPVDVNAISLHDQTAVGFAIDSGRKGLQGSVDVLQLLLDKGARAPLLSEKSLKILREPMRTWLAPHVRRRRRRSFLIFLYGTGLWTLSSGAGGSLASVLGVRGYDGRPAGSNTLIGPAVVLQVLGDPYLGRFLVKFL